MDNIPELQALPKTSFEFSRKNQDNIIISYGPKNGLLWRGEEVNIQEINLIDGLNKVFQTGFQGIGGNVLEDLPYIQSHYPGFIGASNTYRYGDESFGRDHEGLSAGTYGYIYLIDTDKKNRMESIPLCKENIRKTAFVTGYKGDHEGNMIIEGPEYAIIRQPDFKFIIGAIPSEFVAFALGIDEKGFIINPAYKKICFEKIEKAIGEEFLLITPRYLRMKYPNLSLSEVYQRYLQADEMISARSDLSLTSSNVVSPAAFFQLPDLTPVNEYAYSHQCGK